MNVALRGREVAVARDGSRTPSTLSLTEPLARLAAVLDDLDNTGTEGLNGGNVVGEDTHVTGRGGEVDLGHASRRVEGLVC